MRSQSILLALCATFVTAFTLSASAADPYVEPFSLILSGLDPAKGMAELKSMAEKGDAQAAIFLGDLYHSPPQSVAKDDLEAVKWYRMASDKGIALAQYALGKFYLLGEGVPSNPVEAIRLTRLSANQGYPKAEVAMGQYYRNPELYQQHDTKPDLIAGDRWILLAAEQGNSDGQAIMGMFYESGDGVAQDYVAAYKWDRLAISSLLVEKRTDDAQQARSYREELGKKMTGAQIARAEVLATDWKPASKNAQGSVVPKNDYRACLISAADRLDDHISDASSVARGVLATCKDQLEKMVESDTAGASAQSRSQICAAVMADPRYLDNAIEIVLSERRARPQVSH